MGISSLGNSSVLLQQPALCGADRIGKACLQQQGEPPILTRLVAQIADGRFNRVSGRLFCARWLHGLDLPTRATALQGEDSQTSRRNAACRA